MEAFPFVDASGPRLVLIAPAFGGTAIAIPLHYMTTTEAVPPAQRGAVFGIVAGIGTLSGLVPKGVSAGRSLWTQRMNSFLG